MCSLKWLLRNKPYIPQQHLLQLQQHFHIGEKQRRKEERERRKEQKVKNGEHKEQMGDQNWRIDNGGEEGGRIRETEHTLHFNRLILQHCRGNAAHWGNGVCSLQWLLRNKPIYYANNYCNFNSFSTLANKKGGKKKEEGAKGEKWRTKGADGAPELEE